MTQNGHLVFKSGVNHNISFQAVSGGFINVGNDDLSVIVQSVSILIIINYYAMESYVQALEI